MPLPMPVAPEQSGEAVDQEEMPVPKPVERPVEVIAVRAGVFRRCRRGPGDKFTVPSFDLLGEWMKCVDPRLEKQHQANIKERKAKIKAAQLAAK